MISGEDVSDFVPFLFQKAKKLYVNRPNEEKKVICTIFLNIIYRRKLQDVIQFFCCFFYYEFLVRLYLDCGGSPQSYH